MKATIEMKNVRAGGRTVRHVSPRPPPGRLLHLLLPVSNPLFLLTHSCPASAFLRFMLSALFTCVCVCACVCLVSCSAAQAVHLSVLFHRVLLKGHSVALAFSPNVILLFFF